MNRNIGRKRSPLWNHFSILNGDKAKCDVCKAEFSYKGGSIANLRKHFTSKHPTILTEKRRNQQNIPIVTCPIVALSSTSPVVGSASHKVPAPASPILEVPSTSGNVPARAVQISRPHKTHDMLLNMIVKDFHPISIVEDQGFQELIASFEPSYQLPNQTTIRDILLPQRYLSVVQVLKGYLAEAGCITLTTDVWESAACERYMSVAAHFITDSWEISSCFLECFKYENKVSSIYLVNELKRVVTEWGIADKVIAIVTDNGEMLNPRWPQLPCFTNAIDAIVKSGLKTIKIIHEKVRAIVEYFHGSTAAGEKLLQMQQDDTPLKLETDLDEHWTTTYYMFRGICKIQKPVEAVTSTFRNSVEVLTQDDWIICKDICNILMPFEQVLLQMSSQRDMSASKVIVISQGLEKQLERLRSTLSKTVSLQLVKSLQTSLTGKFTQVEHNVILAKATFLDPRFKAIAFKDSAALKKVQNGLNSEILKMAPRQNRPANTNQRQQAVNVGFNEETSWMWEELDRRNSDTEVTPETLATCEIRQYSEEHNISRKDNPLPWWKTRGELRYPSLAKLAKKYLSVIATSVPSERIITKHGQSLSERRSRLEAANVKKLVFLNYNQKMLPH